MRAVRVLALAAVLGPPASAAAAPLEVDGIAYFVQRFLSDFAGSDPVSGHEFVVAAACVSPDGDAAGVPECRETPAFDHTATLGVATLPDGSQRDLLHLPGTNQFFRQIDFDPVLSLDALELTFTNEGDVSVALTPDLFGFVDIPIVVPAVSGTDSVTPTFSWVLPPLPHGAVDAIHLAISDPFFTETLVSVDLAPTQTSFQVPASAGLVPGFLYPFNLIVADTRDGAPIAPLAPNVRAWSSYSSHLLLLPEPGTPALGALVLAALLARRRYTRPLRRG